MRELIRSLKLTSPADVARALDLLQVNPSKSLGQNFLIDANILGIILKTADLSAGDAVLEIGAGLGTLTEALAGTARRVAAVEKDYRLADFLQERLQPFANVELIVADVMQLNLAQFWAAGINKLVANLPYSIGSAALAGIFKGDSRPGTIVVTLQTEVARRLAARPDTDDYGLLSIWGQLHYETEICRLISPNCFFPKPEVQSAILRMKERPRPAGEIIHRDFFFGLTKHAFGQRRKQLQKILANAPPQFRRAGTELLKIFQKAEIDPRARPETLGIDRWIMLSGLLAAGGGKVARPAP
ncbi:MAG: 16S rRNA (adenine(1518)-N(6)/adenine(1519)-N(6))-dimethyltransferase RsmA [Kiritimatiellae bacterium]|nr:16S rRNA (adenine(1518)-N(6)/adenine(1519)-N(6))-dimethyltransferase RsmA [Kiritimatiellia bacterium]